MYRSITIRAPDEQDLTELDLSILSEGARNLTLVKDVQVTAHFHRRLRSRCPRYYESESESEEEEDDDDEEEEGEEEDDDLTDDFEDGLLSDDGENDEVEDDLLSNDSGDESDTNVIGEEADNEPPGSELELNNETLDVERGLQGTAQALSNHDEFLAVLESRLMPLLDNIPEGRLRSFQFVIL